MFRVAMLSKWHVHAAGYARTINAIPGCEVAYVWDEDAARGKAWAEELGVPFFENLDELLAKKDFDGVLVDTPTTMHDSVIPAAAKAGKHIFTEKALSVTNEGAEMIAKAVEAAGVKFCISYPWRTMPANVYLKDAVESGKIGEVSLLRVRNGHDGSLAGWLPEYWYDPKLTGGGAMMDLGCHPVYIANWVLGQAKSAYAVMTYQTGRIVEDTAVCSVEYENGAVAQLETSLYTPHSPNTVEIYGTKGGIHCFGNDILVKYNGYEGWTRPDRLPKVPTPLETWVNGVTKGEKIDFDLDAAKALTRVMVALYESAGKKAAVAI